MRRMPACKQQPDQGRIVVGVSGGVDSAVTLLILKESGYDVHGLHMTNWEDDDGYCTAAQDLQDARDVCRQLDVPLHHVNFAGEYRERVFRYFLDEYAAGRTPNPDVLCNREIKFGSFRAYARRLGAARIATGHYARITRASTGVELMKGRDSNKDQSYFLHAVAADALAEAEFPLGELQKSEVRTLARDHGLAPRDKKDSTGICFIGERPFREFLSRYLPARPGRIETPAGDEIGEHHGLMYYTLGQRQGLGVGGLADADDRPWYVGAKDLERNVLIAVQGDHPMLYSTHADLGPANWLGQPPPLASLERGLRCSVKVRYRQPDQACVVRPGAGGGLEVSFDAPQRAVAPGQYAVFYSGDRCLGGSVINTVRRDEAILGLTG